jgi:WD40 repeat protein
MRNISPNERKVLSPNGFFCARLSPDGKTVLLLDAGTNQILGHFAHHTQRVYDLAWSPDSASIASASLDGTVVVSPVDARGPFLCYRGHSDGVIAVSFAPDGQYAASGSWDRTVQVWDCQPGVPEDDRRRVTYTGHSSAVYTVTFSPDGALIASAELHGPVHVWEWDAPARACRQIWTTHPDSYAEELAWTQEGYLALHLDRGSIEVWDARAGTFQGSPSRMSQEALPARV